LCVTKLHLILIKHSWWNYMNLLLVNCHPTCWCYILFFLFVYCVCMIILVYMSCVCVWSEAGISELIPVTLYGSGFIFNMNFQFIFMVWLTRKWT
jgi:hypothetical protein